MKRRQAIRQIVVVSSGLVLLPACDFRQFKSYEYLPLEKEQYRIIEALQTAILPMEKMSAEDAETPMYYMLDRINDCYEMKDIEEFLTGLKDFQQGISNRFEMSFEKLKPEEQAQILEETFDEETPDDETPSPIKDFLKTTKNLTVEYFTKSEDYLANYLEYEFIPSRYSGCVNI